MTLNHEEIQIKDHVVTLDHEEIQIEGHDTEPCGDTDQR